METVDLATVVKRRAVGSIQAGFRLDRAERESGLSVFGQFLLLPELQEVVVRMLALGGKIGRVFPLGGHYSNKLSVIAVRRPDYMITLK